MLIYIILLFIYGVVYVVTSPLLLLNLIPNFTVTSGTLPFGTDVLWVYAVSTFKAILPLFPPFEIVYQASLIYLGFEILMFVLRLILGARLKDHSLE